VRRLPRFHCWIMMEHLSTLSDSFEATLWRKVRKNQSGVISRAARVYPYPRIRVDSVNDRTGRVWVRFQRVRVYPYNWWKCCDFNWVNIYDEHVHHQIGWKCCNLNLDNFKMRLPPWGVGKLLPFFPYSTNLFQILWKCCDSDSTHIYYDKMRNY